MPNIRPQKPIRVGVFGVGRGQSFAGQAAAMEGVELVALCDMREKALAAFAEQMRDGEGRRGTSPRPTAAEVTR
jgi:predicted homoserine dehydrogenase-like protein